MGAEVTRKAYGMTRANLLIRAVKRESDLNGRCFALRRIARPGIVEDVEENPAIEYLTVPELVELFGSSVGKVHRLLEDHYLAAVKIDGVVKVPTEFVQNGDVIPSLRGTLLALLDCGFSEEEAVHWLLHENDELGERPIAVLRDGRKSAVRRATQSLAF